MRGRMHREHDAEGTVRRDGEQQKGVRENSRSETAKQICDGEQCVMETREGLREYDREYVEFVCRGSL